MPETGFLIQLITFVTVVAFFDFQERRRPGFLVDRRRELPINIAAMFIVIFMGEYVKKFIGFGFEALKLAQTMPSTWFSEWPGPAKIVLGIILTDFSLYWVHRAMHHQILWRTHVFHHSIPEIWWLAGARTSIFHLTLFAIPQVFISYYLLRLSPMELGIAISFGIVINIWIHTNLWVNLGRLEWLLVTSNYHRIHHGGQGLMSRNMGFVFTIWDRMFGTYTNPRAVGNKFAIFPVPTGKELLRMMIGI